jgi:hypothetical protein
MDPARELPYRPAAAQRRITGRTDGSIRLRAIAVPKFSLARRGAFSNRISLVNDFFVTTPGHGSLRGRNNPPQHLVRSTGAAMSTTSWRAMTPLKAHSRSRPSPRPAGNHYIRDFARMHLNGIEVYAVAGSGQRYGSPERQML